LSWNGTTLTINGTINVVGGNAATTTYVDTADATKANISLNNSSISTLISGSSIRVGSGIKDSTLSGWVIDSTEIVGQASGIEQVAMNTSGQIIAGAGRVGLWRNGIGLSFPINDAWESQQRVSFLRSTLTGTEQGYLGARTFSAGADFQLEMVALGNGSSWGTIKLVGSTLTAGASSSSSGVLLVQPGNVFVPYRGLVVHPDFVTYGATIRTSGSILAKSLEVTDSVGTWTNLTLTSPWTNNGGGWATAQYCELGDWITIKGLVTPTTNQIANATIMTLPVEIRPTENHRFVGLAAGVAVNLDVLSTGVVRLNGAINVGQVGSIECMYKK
jgi:hypothetical protein